MSKPVDVLLFESHAGAGDESALTLMAAGHRVHRCHDPEDRGLPCRGMVDPDACPLEGNIDVALLVRRDVHPRPTALEHPVVCAVRSGIPLVVQGPSNLDPFDAWATERVEDHDPDKLVRACESACTSAHRPLEREIMSRIDRILTAGGITPADVTCAVVADGPALRIVFDVPSAVGRATEQALAVRALDAIRTSRRTFGEVNVEVHHPHATPSSFA
jgi:hypothetical protein